MLAVVPWTGRAAGVSCASASSAVEVLICRNHDLRVLDTEMGTAYEDLRRVLDDAGREALLQSQRAWLRKRERCESFKDCIERETRQRRDELRMRKERLLTPNAAVAGPASGAAMAAPSAVVPTPPVSERPAGSEPAARPSESRATPAAPAALPQVLPAARPSAVSVQADAKPAVEPAQARATVASSSNGEPPSGTVDDAAVDSPSSPPTPVIAADLAPAPAAAEPVEAPPIAATEPAADPTDAGSGPEERQWPSPYLIGGGAAAILALFLAGVIVARRRADYDDGHEPTAYEGSTARADLRSRSPSTTPVADNGAAVNLESTQPLPVVEAAVLESPVTPASETPSVAPRESAPASRAFCTKCGHRLQPDVRFCTKCGAKRV